VENLVFGRWLEPKMINNGADLIVSPTQWGLASRVAAEAMACGCPTIILEGLEDKPASAKCQDRPSSMAGAIVDLWEKNKDDPKGERRRAREIAETSYNIRDTAKELMQIVREL